MKSLFGLILLLSFAVHAKPVSKPAPRAIDPLTLTSETPVSRSSLVAMRPAAPSARTRAVRAKTVKRGNMIAANTKIAVNTMPTVEATRAPERRETPVPKRDFTALVSVGLDMRGERDQQQSTIPRSWPTLTLGLGLKPWMGLLEYASFSENSGNNALNVQRKVETLLLWGHWSPDEEWLVQPYMGIGFGGYRTSAEMTLYSQRTGSQGKWIEHGAGALGLRLAKLSPFLLAVEGRVHMNRELDPSPTQIGRAHV